MSSRKKCFKQLSLIGIIRVPVHNNHNTFVSNAASDSIQPKNNQE